MQVFKGFCKILKKNWFIIAIYIIIFGIISAIVSHTSGSNQYEIVKVNTYMECQDDSEFSESFKAYLEQYIYPVDIGNSSIEDALFYDDIDMYIKIPSNFEEKLYRNETGFITIQTTPDSLYAYSLLENITSLLNEVKIVHQEDETLSNCMAKAITIFNEAGNSFNVEISNSTSNSKLIYFYNYGAYILGSIILAIIGVVMYSFKPLDIKRRMNICSYSNRKINSILIAANLLFGVFLLGLFMLLTLVLFGASSFNLKSLYYMINLSLICSSFTVIAYLIATCVRSKQIVSALGVIIPLAGGFLGGIFVPMEYLSEQALFFGKFLPQYWFVLANEYITNQSVSFSGLVSHLYPQLIFIVVFIIATIALTKFQSKKEN